MGAERQRARRLLRLEPDARFEPLPVGVDQADERNWRVAQARREKGDVVVGALRNRVEDPVPAQRSDALGLVFRNLRFLHLPEPRGTDASKPGERLGVGRLPVEKVPLDARAATLGARCTARHRCSMVPRHA